MKPLHYYAVIFSNTLKEENETYNLMAEKMEILAKSMKGYIGFESVRDTNLHAISISYWETEQDILNWKNQTDHLLAQEMGKANFYKNYKVRVCKVEREYEF